jgi:hypothetical protein
MAGGVFTPMLVHCVDVAFVRRDLGCELVLVLVVVPIA